MKTSFLYKQKWNTRCAFTRKMEKMLPLHQKFFFWWNGLVFHWGLQYIIIRGTLHDCLEKGNSNSNVILTPSAAKKSFIVKRFGISLGFTVYTIRRTLRDCLEKYINFLFSLWKKKYFPCSLHSLVEYSYNTQRQILYLVAAM